MPKAKRNDPCPCGSGKKYKNCCMLQDRVSASRELGSGGMAGYLLNTLYDYSQSPRFAADLGDAFALFWGGLYDLNKVSEIEPDDMRRMFEWFIHDYRTRTDQKRVIEVYLEREGLKLTSEARELVEAWAQSTMGLWRLRNLADADLLELYDPLRQETLQVHDNALAHNARPGDLLIGRMYTYQNTRRLSMMTTLLPNAYEEGLVEYVTNAYRIYQDEHPGAAWDVFLRETGYIFNAYLTSTRGESLRGLIGPGTRFQDPAITRDKLRALTRQSEQEARAERTQQRRAAPPVRRTASGLILPGSAEASSPQTSRPKPQNDAPAPRILIPGRDA